MPYDISLQSHRGSAHWVCKVCGKKIEGTINTIHLGMISHINAEWRRGLREKPYDPYGRFNKRGA